MDNTVTTRRTARGTTRRTARGMATVVIVLVALLATSVATAVPAEAQQRDVAAEPIRDRPNDLVEELRFACGPEIVGDQRGVLCRWSASTNDAVRGYQLYRIVNGAARELVATVPAGARLHAFDADLEAGDRVIYGVVARNRVGRVIGIGGPVRLAIPG